MKIAHIADLHLGYSAHKRVHENGMNIRQVDVVTAFRDAVDQIITARCDLCLVGGDVFDVAKPSNAVLVEAERQFCRLAEHMPIVVVGGNHDAPRSMIVGNPLRVVREVAPSRIHLVLDQAEIVSVANTAVLCLPHGAHRNVDRVLNEARTFQQLAHKRKLLLAHVAVQGIDGAYMYGELPAEVLDPKRWDYVALGDFHICTQLAPNAWYSGSLEYVSAGGPWDETATPKGPCASCGGSGAAKDMTIW